MNQLLLPTLTALLITVLTTPLVIKLAETLGLVDDPKLRPHPAHVQRRVVPRAGGLPIFLGIIISMLLFIPISKPIIGILLGILLLLVVGLVDDYVKDFSPYPRLLMQIISAGIIVASGVGITFITNPWGGILRLDQIIYQINFWGTHNIILIADILAFFWIVFVMNMVNWSKGVDGQMPGIMLVAATTIGLLSLKLAGQGDSNQLNIARLSFITAAASFGFLIFNWHPAKIFPGFSGSTILGFMIAVLSILSGAKLATALLVLLVPAVDFFYTLTRRILSGHSPFLGDSAHLHHLLLQRGWSHAQISLFYIISCAILGLLATSLSTQGKAFVASAIGVVILGSLLWLHQLSRSLKPSASDNG